jgi:hypothetical protein
MLILPEVFFHIIADETHFPFTVLPAFPDGLHNRCATQTGSIS